MFVAGAKMVADTLDDPVVGAAWGTDSVLEHQSIGSLCGHMARGCVAIVEEYLDKGDAVGDVSLSSAGHYFASVMDGLDDDGHAGIRARGVEVAEEGWEAIVERTNDAAARLEERLEAEPAGRLIEVFGGHLMRLDDYLHTRIIEQVVHLDDLARSLERPAPRFPPGTVQLTIACALEIGRRRHDVVELMRALYRDPTNGVLPVLH